MAKRGKQAEGGGGGGCPDYMMTYGDMMSLLLCFFVMIVSLSQIKEDEMFKAAMESIKKAFGYTTSPSPIPGEFVEKNSMTDLIESIRENIVQRQRKHRGKQGEAEDEKSQIGKSSTVRSIRDGLKITIGGMSLFEPGTANLLPEAKEELTALAEQIRGYKNRVLVRGHASRVPLPEESTYKDKIDLSHARAVAVRDYLVSQDVEPRRLNVEACGSHEPIRVHAAKGYGGQAPNRRVEIIVKQTMIDDVEGDGNVQDSSGGSADG